MTREERNAMARLKREVLPALEQEPAPLKPAEVVLLFAVGIGVITVIALVLMGALR